MIRILREAEKGYYSTFRAPLRLVVVHTILSYFFSMFVKASLSLIKTAWNSARAQRIGNG